LKNDIDLTSYLSSTGAGYNSGAGWEPIGKGSNRFYGKFNGQNHKVSGLWINRPTETDVGLFGDISGEIINIGVEIDDGKGGVVGGWFVGGLVGDNLGTISNVGGLVGNFPDAIINSYYNKQTSGQTDEGKGEGKTTAEMKTQSTYVGWDFQSTWVILNTANNGYPVLEWQLKDYPTYTVNFNLDGGSASAGNILVHSTNKTIMLSNLPRGAKVDVYNVQGKQIYSTHSENSEILRIAVQTKGMYIVKVGTQTMRVAVR